MITPELLAEVYEAPLARCRAWAPILADACKVYEIDTQQRLACFLAQIGHESGRLRFSREIWGPTKQQLRYEPGTKLARNLGNTQEGDGKLYMGRGLIQTTGRTNYGLLTTRMRRRFPNCPDFVGTPQALEQRFWAAMSAGDFWNMRNLNRIADAYDFALLTKRINGGLTGLADRQALYSRAFAVLTMRG